ncbi:MAG: hypothetical protein WC223_03090 [Bacteroidales bacterium]|jgi:hypothetical protein
MFKNKKQKLTITIITIFPLLLIFLGILSKNGIGVYNLFTLDPEYSYLFNSLNISRFSLKVFHVDHPGTPLQIFGALIIRIVHLFHSKEPLLVDVFKNPEFYLHSINISLLLINSIALFLLGYYAYRISKNIIICIFLQLTPFASNQVVWFFDRVNIEQMLIFTMILFVCLLFKYLHDYDIENKKIIDKYLLLFSVIVGFGIACKITFFPIFLIPFILMDGFKKKLFYTIFSISFFSFFIIPVIIYKHDYFIDWIRVLFFHSGQYGRGESNIIDTTNFIFNLKTIFNNELFFSIVFLLVIFSSIIYHIPFLKVKEKNDKYYKALLGIEIAMLLQIVIVAKHYSFHYLIPALMLTIIAFFVMLKIYSRKFNIRFINLAYIVIIFYIILFESKEVKREYSSNLKRKNTYLKTYNFILKNYNNKPTLVIPDYYVCPYKESAFKFGIYWGGDYFKDKYIEVLAKLYTNIYIYSGWNKMFNDWENAYSCTDLLKKYNNIILYSDDPEIENNIVLHELNSINEFFDIKIIKTFYNKETNESIYEISYSPKFNRKVVSIFCDAETLSDNKYSFIGTNNRIFSNGNTQSNEKFLSGKYSAKLTKDSPYGFTYIIGKLKSGDELFISVWRYKSNTDASLILSAKNTKKLYIAENKAIKTKNNWEEIIIDYKVPENLNNEEFEVYVWNMSNKVAYFDDLKIEKIQQNKNP